MFKKIISILILVCLVAAIVLVWYVNQGLPSYENPISLMKADKLEGYMLQSKRQWKEPDNAIKSVLVVKDEPNLLEVKVDYRYSGEQGTEVSTCGGIHEDLKSYNMKWSCRPTRLKKGERSVILGFTLIDDRSGDRECSQAVALAFYKHQGSDFYRDYYLYKKAWIKGEKGLLGRLKQFLFLQTSCKNKNKI